MSSPAEHDMDGDFADTLRAAIADRGLSLERVRYHLAVRGHDVSVATLSYWQSGRSRPERSRSLAAMGALEEILQLRPGQLLDRLASRRRSRRVIAMPRPVPGYSGISPQGAVVDHLVEELGLDWDDGLQRVAVYEFLDIGADRTKTAHLVRTLLRATRSGVDRLPVAYQYDDPRASGTVAPLKNCQLGRVAHAPEHRIVVADLRLDRPLAQDESILIEYRLDTHGQRIPTAFWERSCRATMRELHIEVRFDASAIPVSAETYTLVDAVSQTRPVVVTGAVITVLQQDFGPGTTGVRWGWFTA